MKELQVLQGTIQMVCNMLERDDRPVRKEASEELRNAMAALVERLNSTAAQSQPEGPHQHRNVFGSEAQLSDVEIVEEANRWVKAEGWFEFERNDFLGCIRALMRRLRLSHDHLKHAAERQQFRYAMQSLKRIACGQVENSERFAFSALKHIDPVIFAEFVEALKLQNPGRLVTLGYVERIPGDSPVASAWLREAAK
jgi:hypothetical protein